MNVRWIVELSEAERAFLEGLVRGGTLGARTMKRALILLRSDDGWTAEEVAEALEAGTATVFRARERYVEVGLPEALYERHRIGAPRKLDALQEATLVALACSKAPPGRAKWTMQLLADEPHGPSVVASPRVPNPDGSVQGSLRVTATASFTACLGLGRLSSRLVGLGRETAAELWPRP